MERSCDNLQLLNRQWLGSRVTVVRRRIPRFCHCVHSCASARMCSDNCHSNKHHTPNPICAVQVILLNTYRGKLHGTAGKQCPGVSDTESFTFCSIISNAYETQAIPSKSAMLRNHQCHSQQHKEHAVLLLGLKRHASHCMGYKSQRSLTSLGWFSRRIGRKFPVTVEYCWMAVCPSIFLVAFAMRCPLSWNWSSSAV